MVLQEHQSSSRSCWRPQPGVMGPRHFLGAFKISPGLRLKLWSLHCSAGTTPIPKISVYLGRCCLPGVFLYGRMGFFQHQIHRRKTPRISVSVQEIAMTWQYPENGVADGEIWFQSESFVVSIISICHLSSLGMDQYLLIPFLGGWTSIYQLFWCSPGVQGFDTLPFLQPWFLHSEFTAAIGKLTGLFWWSAGKGLRRQRGHVVGWSRKAGPDDESDPGWSRKI